MAVCSSPYGPRPLRQRLGCVLPGEYPAGDRFFSYGICGAGDRNMCRRHQVRSGYYGADRTTFLRIGSRLVEQLEVPGLWRREVAPDEAEVQLHHVMPTWTRERRGRLLRFRQGVCRYFRYLWKSRGLPGSRREPVERPITLPMVWGRSRRTSRPALDRLPMPEGDCHHYLPRVRQPGDEHRQGGPLLLVARPSRRSRPPTGGPPAGRPASAGAMPPAQRCFNRATGLSRGRRIFSQKPS